MLAYFTYETQDHCMSGVLASAPKIMCDARVCDQLPHWITIMNKGCTASGNCDTHSTTRLCVYLLCEEWCNSCSLFGFPSSNETPDYFYG